MTGVSGGFSRELTRQLFECCDRYSSAVTAFPAPAATQVLGWYHVDDSWGCTVLRLCSVAR